MSGAVFMKLGRAPTTCRTFKRSTGVLSHGRQLAARVGDARLNHRMADRLRAREPLLDARHQDAREPLGAERARAFAGAAPDAEDVRLVVGGIRGGEHVVELPEAGDLAVQA